MTIYLYTGTPGSGKSLHTAKLIVQTLRYKKLPVVCNFPINEDTKGYDRFSYVDNFHLTPQYLYDFAMSYWDGKPVKEDYILLVVDEAQLLFNSREWGQKNRMEWIEFLSQHRHYGYKIVFIAQFDRMIDRQIRALVEYEYVHRRLGSLGWKGKMMALFAGGELFVCSKKFYGMNAFVGAEYMRKRKRYFRLYDSYATFSRTDGGAEGKGATGDPAPMPAARQDERRAAGRELDIPPMRKPFPERLRIALSRLSRRFTGSEGRHAKA
jgi:zona occludens toxin